MAKLKLEIMTPKKTKMPKLYLNLEEGHLALLIYGQNIPMLPGTSDYKGIVIGGLAMIGGHPAYLPIAEEEDIPSDGQAYRKESFVKESLIEEPVMKIRPPFDIPYGQMIIRIAEMEAEGRRGKRRERA